MSTSTIDESQPGEMVSAIVRLSMYWVSINLLVVSAASSFTWSITRLAGTFVLGSLAITVLAYVSMQSRYYWRSLEANVNRWTLMVHTLVIPGMEIISVMCLVKALNQLLF